MLNALAVLIGRDLLPGTRRSQKVAILTYLQFEHNIWMKTKRCVEKKNEERGFTGAQLRM